MPATLRRILAGAIALVALAAQRLPLPVWTRSAEAASPTWRHGISAFGDLKYPAGFKQFEYVNAKAPKAGVARQIALGTYDNFNTVIDGVKGALAFGCASLFAGFFFKLAPSALPRGEKHCRRR